MRSATAFSRSGFVGPRFEPDDEPALYGNGVVADGRLKLPEGTFLRWTGQYELLEQMRERIPPQLYEIVAGSAATPSVEDLDI